MAYIVYHYLRITFPELEKEIYVHEYYLRNLCDETTYPDWPIGDPLKLLRVSRTMEPLITL